MIWTFAHSPSGRPLPTDYAWSQSPPEGRCYAMPRSPALIAVPAVWAGELAAGPGPCAWTWRNARCPEVRGGASKIQEGEQPRDETGNPCPGIDEFVIHHFYRRCPKPRLSFKACCRRAPAVRFIKREILATGVLFFEWAFNSR
jgi:hypothetical protein